MKTTKTHFNQTKIWTSAMMVLALCTFDANAAAVVSRTQRPSTSASRMPTMAVRLNSGTSATQTKSDTTQTTADTTDIVDTSDDTKTYESETIEIDETPDEIIENKASQFADVLSDAGTSSDAGRTTLAEQIRAQRAALDAADAAQSAAAQMQSALSSGQNACDVNLRACMTEKCGKNFSKCAGDTDTLWGTKLDACRRDLPCSGEEYRLFTIEIKADRDAYARVANYNRIVDCGNRYNDCIITQCGTNFDKCLGKSAGDKAISACEKIARECTESDSGLAARAMDVFGTLRGNAERQVQRDEERLYELRNLMSSTCKRLGAMFDERTLDCVYTINFIAGPDNTLYASKKAYAGSTFDCDQNWFGVDITTFKENAFRLTREQKSATSALMGSGVGMAVGAITSGAIDRAVDRHKAEKAVKDAQAEHDEYYGDKTQESGNQTAKNANNSAKSDKKAERQEKRDAKKAERQEKREERQEKRDERQEQKQKEKENKKAEQQKSDNSDKDANSSAKPDKNTNNSAKPDKDANNSAKPDKDANNSANSDKQAQPDERQGKKKLNKNAPKTSAEIQQDLEKANQEIYAKQAKQAQKNINKDNKIADIPTERQFQREVKKMMNEFDLDVSPIETSPEPSPTFDSEYALYDLDANNNLASHVYNHGETCINKGLQNMTDDELTACAERIRNHFPIVSGVNCIYNGESGVCRTTPNYANAIETLRQRCAEHSGTMRVEQDTHSARFTWPFQQGFYSIVHCSFPNTENYYEFFNKYNKDYDFWDPEISEDGQTGTAVLNNYDMTFLI